MDFKVINLIQTHMEAVEKDDDGGNDMEDYDYPTALSVVNGARMNSVFNTP